MTIGSHEWKLKALTPIWTGDVDQKGNRLIPTGLMGSLRWWFEVLVRGLGGKACDPTSPVRCPDHNVKDPAKPGHRCVVCELFGCTGWARKFRMMVLEEQSNVTQNQIEANLILRFIPLRRICPEEWCLLDCTLRLIAEYGAIGGKTVLKPSDEPNRESGAHHRDYGLIQYVSGPRNWRCEDFGSYVAQRQWRCKFDDRAFSWASLQNFWCVKGRYLARQNANQSTFNKVVGRKPDKSERERRGERIIRWSDLLENPGDSVAVWLAGRQRESKKVFSFKHPQEGGRTFGFVKPGTVDFKEMKGRLGNAWQDFQDSEFLTGDEILKSLFEGGAR